MIPLLVGAALAAAPTPPAEPDAGPPALTLPAARPGGDDLTLGLRTTRAGLWMGGAGLGAVAIGVPVTLVGALMSFDTPQPGAPVVVAIGGTLVVGGSLAALAGPYVCAAGELRARRALAAPPSRALPWIVVGSGAAAALTAGAAFATGSDGEAALPFLAVGGVALVGSYAVAAVDLGLLGHAARAEVTVVPTGNGVLVGATF